MKDIQQHRRMAAWECFKPHLPETELWQAIRMLDSDHQIDSPTAQIAYVKKVAMTFGIDDAVRKSLYQQFHQLLQHPLGSFDLQPLQAANSPVIPNITWPMAIQESEVVAAAPRSAAVNLFAILTGYVIERTANDELFDILGELGQEEMEMAALIGRWQVDSRDYAWAVELQETTLKRLVHTLYTAVCELVGPVEADRRFHEALGLCLKQPDAQQFPPGRFF